jgi:Sec-independent protein secretion pathway component TatC
MCLLYEIGIWACVFWVKPKKADEAEKETSA